MLTEAYASSKKFLGSLEPLLLAPPGKPLVSGPTQQVLTEVLAGLVYQYGNDKGCEGLRDLWLKVKLPQDNEMVGFVKNCLIADSVGLPPSDRSLDFRQRSCGTCTSSTPSS